MVVKEHERPVSRPESSPVKYGGGPRGRGRTRRHDRSTPYLWLMPTFMVMFVIVAFPWLWSLVLSFYKWSAAGSEGPTFVGLENYASMLSSNDFWQSVGLTGILLVITVPFEVAAGLCMASLLNTDPRGRGAWQTVMLVPFVVTPVMVGVAWKVLLDPVFGILSYGQRLMGLGSTGWLTDPHLSLVVVATMEIWKNTPLLMVILLAGLQSMPSELHDAAAIDGASAIQELWHITLGYIRPFVMFAVLLVTMFAIRTFDTVYGLFNSAGPENGASVLGVNLYQRFTSTYSIGESSTMAVLMVLATILVTMPFLRGATRGSEE